jgi:hypothetical protein
MVTGCNQDAGVVKAIQSLKGNDLVTYSLKLATVPKALDAIRSGLEDNPRIIRKVLGKQCNLILNYMFKNGTKIKSTLTNRLYEKEVDKWWVEGEDTPTIIDESLIGTQYVVVSSPDDVPKPDAESDKTDEWEIKNQLEQDELDDLYKRDEDRYNR